MNNHDFDNNFRCVNCGCTLEYLCMHPIECLKRFPVMNAAEVLSAIGGGEKLWLPDAACPDCNGTKTYVGLNSVEPCPTCRPQ